MNSLNITRDEAHRRSTIVTAHSYRVVVDLSGRDPRGEALADPTGTFVSSSTISFTSTGGQTHVDLVADGVYAVVLDGVAAPVRSGGGQVCAHARALLVRWFSCVRV